jgi:thiosulfate reductase cytochrome b subunit
MADSVWGPASAAIVPATTARLRRPAVVRVTHWITTFAFLALLVSGAEIVVSHPRFYWGETGNVRTEALFKLPIPASRATVPTGYNYVVRDQNGWSRYLHFQTAWVLVLTGVLYVVFGMLTGHFRREMLDASSYNPRQRISYLVVIFVLFPLIIWTGLAMSPAAVSAFPALVTILGGQQSARTIHFFVTLLLVLFLLIHLVMIAISGFRARMRGMITGRMEGA